LVSTREKKKLKPAPVATDRLTNAGVTHTIVSKEQQTQVSGKLQQRKTKMAIVFTSDAATLQSNLREAASLTNEQLESRTVYELRDLLRHCGVKQITRSGTNVPIRAARRPELLEALAVATTPFKHLAKASIDMDLVDADIKRLTFEDVANLLVLAAREVTLEDSTKGNEKARSVAYEVNEWIMKTYTDTPSLARFYVRCDQRGDYRSRVRDIVFSKGNLILEGVYGVFATTLNALGKFDSESKATANKARVVNYAANTRTIDVQPLQNWAVGVLGKQPEVGVWKDVVVALAAVTGRRVYSEILSGTSRFAEAGEFELKFSGVSKGKDVNNKEYTIPTIAKASDVVRAIQWLEEVGKRLLCDDLENHAAVLAARKATDKRHSKNLGEYWKKNLCANLLGLAQDDEEAAKDDLTTLHGLRKLYVMHFTRGMSDIQQRHKASELLCHSGDGSVASDAYTTQFKLED
jgi:hypothetical protein